jgi:membrane associated rhomboid family serine protease
MLIPYNTDAPIYHWPIATVGLIVVNTFVALLSMAMSEETFVLFILQYQYFRPWQWLTSNFMHLGWMHLLMNMFNLWAFGLVVEGKLGAPRFLALYLGIGVVQCMFEHLVGFIMGAQGSLGASSIIYGLIAIALVWAPRNHMQCAWIYAGASLFEIPILTMGTMLLSLQVLLGVAGAFFADNAASMITSEFLHLSGAFLGAAVGIALLLFKIVDCEGWDIFSVLRGEHLNRDETKKHENYEQNLKASLESALNDFRTCMQQNQLGMAKKAHLEAKQFIPGWVLPEVDMAALIDAFMKRGQWNDAVELMVEYLKTHQERAVTIRIYLAKVLLEQLQRPMQALKVLAKLAPEQIPAATRAEVEKMRQIALRKVEEDPFEVVHDDW